MHTMTACDATKTPSPAALPRNVPALRALLRRETGVYLNDRARSFLRFRHDHPSKQTKSSIEHPTVEPRLRRHISAGAFDASFRTARHRAQVQLLQTDDIGAIDDDPRLLV